MSFKLSSGTLDSMAGVFTRPKKHRMGTGGGSASPAKAGGAILGFAVASMFPKSSTGSTSGFRPGSQTKQAFGGGGHGATSGRAIGVMSRTAGRAPEVVVRQTGRQHGGGHVLANFSYISRLGHGPDDQVPLYTSDGDVLHDGRDMQILAQDWQEWEMGGDDRRKGATSISLILSMPAGTEPEALREAALDFARTEFANRSWVAALHVDRDHPHVHVTIARRDHDGRRFHPDREDYQRWRQRFAEKLRAHGIEANATPTMARGVDAQHEPIAAKKMREKGQVPRIDKTRAQRAERVQQSGAADPVVTRLQHQQATVKAAYQRSIDELAGSPSFVDKTVARSLEKFIASMPAPEPNSIRARAALSAEPGQGGAPSDRVADALARSRALRESIRAGNVPPGAAPGAADQHQAAARIRTLNEQAQPLPAADTSNPAADALKRVQERDREQRERDRSKDREGPSR